MHIGENAADTTSSKLTIDMIAQTSPADAVAVLMACRQRLERLEVLDPSLSAPLRLQLVALLRESRGRRAANPLLMDRAASLLDACASALKMVGPTRTILATTASPPVATTVGCTPQDS